MSNIDIKNIKAEVQVVINDYLQKKEHYKNYYDSMKEISLWLEKKIKQ